MDSKTAWAEVEAQGPIEPGTPGWWQVWGATVHHARPGDLILCRDGDIDKVVPTYVRDLFRSKAHPVRVGIVTDDDKEVTIGALAPMVLLRRGTHHTLAD